MQKLCLEAELITAELFSQQMIKAMLSGYANSQLLPTKDEIIAKMLNMIQWVKNIQFDILKYKFFFDEGYNQNLTEYLMTPSSTFQERTILAESVINNYVTTLEMIISSNLGAALANFGQSNIYIKYYSMNVNEPYVIRPFLSQSNSENKQWYDVLIEEYKKVIVGVNIALMVTAILWAVLLMPYALSVARINNRVLSLVLSQLFSSPLFRGGKSTTFFMTAPSISARTSRKPRPTRRS
jgi:hypothetical protein